MINRLFLTVIALILSFVSIFGSNHEVFILFRPFVDILGTGGIHTLITSRPNFVFGFIYVAYLVGFFNILKIVLKPVFGGDHEKEATTISLMLSFIGITGMFFIFGRDGGVESAIIMFGGSVGFILLSFVCISLLIFVKNAVDFKQRGWIWFSLALTLVLFTLQVYAMKIAEESGFSSAMWHNIVDALGSGIVWMIFITLFFAVKSWFEYKPENATEEVYDDDETEEEKYDKKRVKDSLTRIQENLKQVDSLVKDIKGGLQ